MAPRLDVDVLIVGGGNAGIAAAARFARHSVSVAVAEPQRIHTYRPLLSWVGGGQAPLDAARRPQSAVTPRRCTWITEAVNSVDADASTARTAAGTTIGYRDLVIGTGLVPDHEALPGIDEALARPGVGSNYLDRAAQTWELVRAQPRGGRAVFTVPRPPVSCTGTTLKPLFLAAGYWRSRGVDPQITLIVDRPDLVGVPDLDTRLDARLRDFGVDVRRETAVTSLEPGHVGTSDGESIPYDMLHLVPPFRGPSWLTDSGLATGPAGLVDVDPRTFRHRRHRSVWSVGDVASVDTDPSGGALRQQVPIMVHNVLAARTGGAFREYDGYTVAPIAVDQHRLIAAEFDRSRRLESSLPSFVDPLEPRRSARLFDRYALPQLYWNAILKGRA